MTHLTKDDFNNLLVFLKRVPCEGLVEATVLAVLGQKLKNILEEVPVGEDSSPAAE